MDKNLGDDTHTTGVGTAGTNVVATEYGDGKHHITKLVLTAVAITVGDNAALGVGSLIYTFPAGVISVKAATGSVALTMEDAIKTDTPEIGLGTVIASGAIATLGAGAATMEDIGGPHAMDDTNGTAELMDSVVALTQPLAIPAASAHTVHLNYADTWANVTDTDSGSTGTIWLEWALLA